MGIHLFSKQCWLVIKTKIGFRFTFCIKQVKNSSVVVLILKKSNHERKMKRETILPTRHCLPWRQESCGCLSDWSKFINISSDRHGDRDLNYFVFQINEFACWLKIFASTYKISCASSHLFSCFRFATPRDKYCALLSH